MSFLHKKLIAKLLLFETGILAIGLLIWNFIPDYSWAGIIAIAILNMAFFFFIVTHPLNRILKEFKALLTGKRYNRIYTKKVDEIGVIAHFFNAITHSLERVSTDIKEHRRISSELNVAQKIQKDLLPQSNPDIQGLDIIAKTRPAAEIGGDSFDFITKGEQTFMYIGDVTGHGVPSGLVMMIVDTLLNTFADMVQTSHQLLTQANKYLKPRIQSTMFMTMIMLRWEHKTQKMFHTGAGHESLIHYKASDKTYDNIKCGGIALGMVPDNSKLIKEQEITFKQGDFIILYTDGIVEARNMEGEMFGTERLLEIIEKYTPKSTNAEDLFQRISTELTHFLGDHIQDDDMTLLVIRKGEKGTQEVIEEKETTKWETEEKEGEQKESLVDYEEQGVTESGLSTE